MAVQNSVAGVKAEIQDFLQSGNYYVTEEVAREISKIDKALDHVCLDNTFLSTSNNWRAKPGNYTAKQANEQMAGSLSAVSMVGSVLNSIKSQHAHKNVMGKEENELRELHHWAMSSLYSAQQAMEPFTVAAADRIKQFGDSLGVTDRYTGYRANLTRETNPESRWMNAQGQIGLMNRMSKSFPSKPELSSLDTPGNYSLMNCLSRSRTTIGPAGFNQLSRNGPGPTHFGADLPPNIGALQKEIGFRPPEEQSPMLVTVGNRTNNSLYPRAPDGRWGYAGGPSYSKTMNEVKALNALNYDNQNNNQGTGTDGVRPRSSAPYLNYTVQEQAGINTTFPGRTEYQHRFKGPVDGPTPDFQINPAPNFGVYKRPMQTAKYTPNFTEYQTRYEWPDSEKIVKLPWLRN